ncbi:MAG: dNTP triphosphohydrolase, partial [Acidobacteriota bacterium]
MPAVGPRPELLSCAFADQATQGRRHPEKPHPYRTEYQRDRDRIIHSKAFRRLENKTQVFGPEYSDHFRNRLTHTLEVTQIARTISQALGLNTDLVEALALSHDIGHPPFSHEGESALDAIMRHCGAGFDHNLHALTIVEDFEEKYASFRGLNLTFEVREGIIKHSRDYDGSEDLYLDIRDYRMGQRPPLEAQLIDLADEVAYNSADLDDGFDSGLLNLPQLLEGSRLFRQLY